MVDCLEMEYKKMALQRNATKFTTIKSQPYGLLAINGYVRDSKFWVAFETTTVATLLPIVLVVAIPIDIKR